MVDSALDAVNLPFDEAIQYFRDKDPNYPTQRFDDLTAEEYAHGFAVAGIQNAQQLADMRQAVDRYIAEGRSLQEFQQDFDENVQRYGWSYRGSRGWRSSLIANQNAFSAYGWGRWEQINNPALIKLRPYRQIRAGGSLEPNVKHSYLTGLVLPAEDPFWEQLGPPPWDYGCKHQIFTLSQEQAEQEGIDEAPKRFVKTKLKNGEFATVAEGTNPLFAKAGSLSQQRQQAIDNSGSRLPEKLRNAILAYLALPGDLPLIAAVMGTVGSPVAVAESSKEQNNGLKLALAGLGLIGLSAAGIVLMAALLKAKSKSRKATTRPTGSSAAAVKLTPEPPPKPMPGGATTPIPPGRKVVDPVEDPVEDPVKPVDAVDEAVEPKVVPATQEVTPELFIRGIDLNKASREQLTTLGLNIRQAARLQRYLRANPQASIDDLKRVVADKSNNLEISEQMIDRMQVVPPRVVPQVKTAAEFESILQSVKGINRKKIAQDIADEIRRNGPFKDKDDLAKRLKKIKGIGPKTIEKLQQQEILDRLSQPGSQSVQDGDTLFMPFDGVEPSNRFTVELTQPKNTQYTKELQDFIDRGKAKAKSIGFDETSNADYLRIMKDKEKVVKMVDQINSDRKQIADWLSRYKNGDSSITVEMLKKKRSELDVIEAEYKVADLFLREDIAALDSKMRPFAEKLRKELLEFKGVSDEAARAEVAKIVIAPKAKEMGVTAEIEQSLVDLVKLYGGKFPPSFQAVIRRLDRPNAVRSKGYIDLGDVAQVAREQETTFNDALQGIVYHEVSHHWESSNPELVKRAIQWIRETADRPLTKLNELYPGEKYFDYERVYPDRHIHEYVGKYYDDEEATEVVSMAIERLRNTEQIINFASGDPDHLYFILAALGYV